MSKKAVFYNPDLATKSILADFSANFDKNFDKVKLNFRSAFLYRKADFFCVIFYWRRSFDAPFVRFRKTYNLNRIQDLKERRKAGALMVEAINKALANGYNPELNTIDNPVFISQKKHFGILEGLRMANDAVLIDKKSRTVSSYNSHLRLFVEYLELVGMDGVLIADFTALDASAYKSWLVGRGFAGKTVNVKLDYICGLFGWCCDMDMVVVNPFGKVRNVKELESVAHDLFTFEELERIKVHLLVVKPSLWLFGLFVYYCFMRPDTIVKLQRKHIDTALHLITIPAEIHKNNRIGYKEILPAHAKYLFPYLEGMDPESFLFSNGGELSPGAKLNYATRAAECWKVFIKMGLGIDKNLYGLKHSGAAHFLALNNGNENLKWLQMQMSHSDLQITSIYTNKLKIVRLDQGAKVVEL